MNSLSGCEAVLFLHTGMELDWIGQVESLCVFVLN